MTRFFTSGGVEESMMGLLSEREYTDDPRLLVRTRWCSFPRVFSRLEGLR